MGNKKTEKRRRVKEERGNKGDLWGREKTTCRRQKRKGRERRQ